MSLSLQEIFAARDVATKEVPVPEWGGSGTVHVRQLSGSEGIQLSARIKDLAGTQAEIGVQRVVIALAVYLSDSAGNKLATEEEAGKLVAVKSLDVLMRIVSAGNDFNGESKDAAEAIAKNSTPSPADSSPST